MELANLPHERSNKLRSNEVEALIRNAKLVFWDFDGVIKESVSAKSIAFQNLFSHFGQDLVFKVIRHHEDNGGVSRYEKIPLYLSWAGQSASKEQVNLYCSNFSRLVFQSVVDSAWVPGVKDYLLNNHAKQFNVLVTATPQDEIHKIVSILGIGHFFIEIIGAPMKKEMAIMTLLKKNNLKYSDTIMIGDSKTDLIAAQKNKVPFLLRRTKFNNSLQIDYNGPMFYDLNHE